MGNMKVNRKMQMNHLINNGYVHSAILTGGFGTRLKGIADPKLNSSPIAKPAIPIGNMRAIEFSVQASVNAGLNELNLLTCYLPHSVRRVVGDGKVYGDNVKVNELSEGSDEALGTAGAAARLVFERGWQHNYDDIVVVLSADIIHTVDIKEVLDLHLFNRQKNNAQATIVVNPIPWDRVASFGTVGLEGMPQRSEYKKDTDFEMAVSEWLLKNERESKNCFKIIEFREKLARSSDEARKQIETSMMGKGILHPKITKEQVHLKTARSPLNNSSIYVFNASLFNNMLGMVTKSIKQDGNKVHLPLYPDLYVAGQSTPFNDFGGHFFPWMVSEMNGNAFPLYAYVLKHSDYWRDAGTGTELLQANMDVLDGKLKTGLEQSEGQYWQRIPNNSWVGKNVKIHPTAFIQNSIIEDDSVIGPNVRIVHSVIGRKTIFEKDSKAYGSMVFPRYRGDGPNVIDEGITINDSIFTGGHLPADPNKKFDPSLEIREESKEYRSAIYSEKDGKINPSSLSGK